MEKALISMPRKLVSLEVTLSSEHAGALIVAFGKAYASYNLRLEVAEAAKVNYYAVGKEWHVEMIVDVTHERTPGLGADTLFSFVDKFCRERGIILEFRKALNQTLDD